MLVFLYALTDEPLTFHLIDLGVPDIAWLVAGITLANTLTVLVIHGLFMNRIARMAEEQALILSLAALALALGLIAGNVGHWPWVWLGAIAVATLAEIIAMPLFLTVIDRIAPAGERNAWFGIYMLSNGGGTAAPLIAAWIIAGPGGAVLFALGATLCLPLGLIGARALRRTSTPRSRPIEDAAL
jgi:MFS family permease